MQVELIVHRSAPDLAGDIDDDVSIEQPRVVYATPATWKQLALQTSSPLMLLYPHRLDQHWCDAKQHHDCQQPQHDALLVTVSLSVTESTTLTPRLVVPASVLIELNRLSNANDPHATDDDAIASGMAYAVPVAADDAAHCVLSRVVLGASTRWAYKHASQNHHLVLGALGQQQNLVAAVGSYVVAAGLQYNVLDTLPYRQGVIDSETIIVLLPEQDDDANNNNNNNPNNNNNNNHGHIGATISSIDATLQCPPPVQCSTSGVSSAASSSSMLYSDRLYSSTSFGSLASVKRCTAEARGIARRLQMPLVFNNDFDSTTGNSSDKHGHFKQVDTNRQIVGSSGLLRALQCISGSWVRLSTMDDQQHSVISQLFLRPANGNTTVNGSNNGGSHHDVHLSPAILHRLGVSDGDTIKLEALRDGSSADTACTVADLVQLERISAPNHELLLPFPTNDVVEQMHLASIRKFFLLAARIVSEHDIVAIALQAPRFVPLKATPTPDKSDANDSNTEHASSASALTAINQRSAIDGGVEQRHLTFNVDQHTHTVASSNRPLMFFRVTKCCDSNNVTLENALIDPKHTQLMMQVWSMMMLAREYFCWSTHTHTLTPNNIASYQRESVTCHYHRTINPTTRGHRWR
jgi:hypothetical protein